MVVADASAVVAAVLESGPRGARARAALAGGASAPHLLDAEVGQALRGAVLRGVIDPDEGPRLLRWAGLLVQERFPHAPLTRLAWSWRSNLSFYDGLYAALAKLMARPLVTADARLAAAVADVVDIELV